MFKKVLIATLAVVVALVVIKGTWLGSHFRLMKKNFRSAVSERVAPEHEIARLRMELDGLSKEDDKHYDKVARQCVEVERVKKQVAKMQKELTERETRIRAMKASLTGEDAYVSLNGTRYSRTDMQTQLRLSGQSFQVDEETLKSKVENLAALEQSLTINTKKLSELKLVRQQMSTELQRLETALSEERQAQAQQANTLDDASYLRLRNELNAVKDRIEVLKKKRELKGEVNGPVRINEERRENEARIDAFINDRFGDKKDNSKQ
jgi:chromosome segregation ATPase